MNQSVKIVRKLARQSPLVYSRGGKSGLHRAGWRLTAVAYSVMVKRGNLHLQQNQIGWHWRCSRLPTGRLLECVSNCAPRWMTVRLRVTEPGLPASFTPPPFPIFGGLGAEIDLFASYFVNFYLAKMHEKFPYSQFKDIQKTSDT